MQKIKQKYLDYFKQVLLETNKLSTCVKRNVSSLLVDDNRIFCFGYNGTLPGFINCNSIKWIDLSKHHEWSEQNEVHAEINLIAFAARYGIKTEGKIIFTSLSPCFNCSKLIIASGIKEVYYLEEHKKWDSGLKLLKKAGIQCKKL